MSSGAGSGGLNCMEKQRVVDAHNKVREGFTPLVTAQDCNVLTRDLTWCSPWEVWRSWQADGRPGPGQGSARRHQHEGDGLGRGARRHCSEVGGPGISNEWKWFISYSIFPLQCMPGHDHRRNVGEWELSKVIDNLTSVQSYRYHNLTSVQS